MPSGGTNWDPSTSGGALPRPASPQPDPSTMTRHQAEFLIRGMDQRLVRSVRASFLYRESRPLIIEGMDAGILGQDEFRALAVAAELRQMRISSLILIILRAFRD